MKIKIGDKMVTAEVDIPNDIDIANYVENLPLSKQKYHNFKTVSLENDRFRNLALAEGKLTPDFKNNECINKTFNCIGFFCDYVPCFDDYCLRCILMDEDCHTYSTVSKGVAKKITNWIDAGIEPSEEYPVLIKYVEVNNGPKRYYTIKVGKEVSDNG